MKVLLLILSFLVFETTSQCIFSTNTGWYGKYPDALQNPFMNAEFNWTVGDRGDFIEASSLATIFGNLVQPLDGTFTVTDYGNSSKQDNLTFCDPSARGDYRMTWRTGCNAVIFTLITDPCTARSARYSGLTLFKASNPKTQVCAFQGSDIFDSRPVIGSTENIAVSTYGGNKDYIHWTPDGRLFMNWAFFNSTVIQLKEYFSSPSIFGCLGTTGTYGLEYLTGCDAVKYHLISDNCPTRIVLYDAVIFWRRGTPQPLVEPPPPKQNSPAKTKVIVNMNFEGIVPAFSNCRCNSTQ